MSAQTPKPETNTLQVGRTDKGHVVVGKDNKPIIFLYPAEALMMAGELLKHASVILSGAKMVEDALMDTGQKDGDGEGKSKIIKPPGGQFIDKKDGEE